MKRLFSLLMLLLVAVLLVACGGGEEELENVELDVSINYTTGGNLYSITYRQAEPYVSSIDGKTYTQGDLTPAWAKIAELTNTTFNDKAVEADKSTNDQWTRLSADGFAGVDLLNGTGQQIGPAGAAGQFVDLGQYLDQMPNLKALLDENPSLNASLRMGNGGLYFTPYFDGLNELEHMFLARVDWIEKVLDWTSSDALSSAAYVVGNSYELTNPESAEYSVVVANEDATTRVVNKAREANILTVMRELANPTGKLLAETLVSYLEETYGGLENSGYAKWSHVFAGTDASYDTDELMALIHVIKANQAFLLEGTGSTQIDGYFPRETKGNRVRQMFRGMEMFGLRGVGSRLEWMFINSDNELIDIRGDESTRDAFVDSVNNLANMVQDGLILQDTSSFPVTNIRESLLKGSNNRLGFLTYDYNASSTGLGDLTKDPDFKFQAILPPVVDWRGNGEYFHFSESNRSIKNEAWGIPIHVASNKEKLDRALLIVDGLFDYENSDSLGTIHLYGPEGWHTGKTISYGQDTVYELSEKFFTEMNQYTGGNHINYLRMYIGATMPIGHIRSLGLEFQTLAADGIEGIERINTAQAAGVLKIAGLVDSDDHWFDLVPTFLPFTEDESTNITSNGTWRDELKNDWLIRYMNNGFTGQGDTLTKEAWYGLLDDQYSIFIEMYQEAYARAIAN